MTPADEKFMDRVLFLAKKGELSTPPNPMVGAVIVKNGKIISEGFHKRSGYLHAEIEALKKLKLSPKGSTLYVNLEPCAHFGKMPPCVHNIADVKFSRVVCASKDPNPVVFGKGIEILKKAGIKVDVGIREKEARFLNRKFFAFHEKKRPYVTVKFAQSIDGKLASKTSDSKWITSEESREFAHKLRAQNQAILVGANTVHRDNPNLGVHSKKWKDPLRIILDSKLSVNADSQVFRDKNVIVAVSELASETKIKLFRNAGIEIVVFCGERVSISELLKELKKREIISLLVEGGGEVIGEFFDANVVDEICVFTAPIIIGGKDAISIGGTGIEKIACSQKFDINEISRIEDDIFIRFLASGKLKSKK